MKYRDKGAFLESVMDQIGDPILVIDPDYNIQFVNKAMEETFGVIEPTKKHRYCYQLLHRLNMRCNEAYGELMPCPGREVILTKRAAKVAQYCLDVSENEIFMEIHASPIFNEAGEVVYVAESYHNITEHKRSQQELQRLTLDLQNALAKTIRMSGVLTICMSCSKIRDEKGFYTKMEDYIKRHTDARITHILCPECEGKLYRKNKGD